MKRINIIFIIFLFSVLGCTDLTEELYDKIPGDLYPENELQVATLSVPAYAAMRPLADDEGWWFLAQEMTSDEVCGPTRDADWDDGGKWRVMHTHTWNNDVEGVNHMWGRLYEAVTTCNKIADELRALPQSEQIDKKIAELEVLRSFYYYLLMDNFGDVPYLETTIDVPEKPFKNKREDIWNELVTTVETNLPQLQNIDKKYLATRPMAFALLAKLYLNAEVYVGQAHYDKAGIYCDSIINSGFYTMDSDPLGPFVTENENNPEIIFSIPYDEDNFKGFRFHMRTLHYQSNLTFDMPVGPWNGFAVLEDHYDSYEDGDLRKEGYFLAGQQYTSDGKEIIDAIAKEKLLFTKHIPALRMDASFTPAEIRMSGVRMVKYEVAKGAIENLSNDFVLFRLADIYLMKAETEIRLNGAGAGDEWIDPIRERANVLPIDGAGLDEILAERGREMFCEGHRRQDLIRFGKFDDAWWEKPSSDPSREIFPIPKWATDANENLLLDPQ
ncbi:MAG: RagB/SusD family nutrient uptake outer membrane protein [Bacteroidales bacterium]|nr:RagB/SusD family nutrient uptake outer membrane protein [Bacteroidales bacterium]MBN2699040.1 RagB/SusD family nutrient uptake outer membrane protein [Bacteroidales bacterium]